MNINFKNVWGCAEEQKESITFWKSRLKTVPFDLNVRSEQVVFHVKHNTRVVGLSTAVKTQLKNFNNHYLFNYRMAIEPGYRIPGLADKLAVETFNFLEGLFHQGDTEAIGIITLIQDKNIIRSKRNAIYSASGLVFAGYTKTGAQIRLKYFAGARI